MTLVLVAMAALLAIALAFLIRAHLSARAERDALIERFRPVADVDAERTRVLAELTDMRLTNEWSRRAGRLV
jgi:hypothetical protein